MIPRGATVFLWRSVLRPLLLRPVRSLSGILSVALGVAVFLSIEIANRSALESFQQAFALVTGRADLEIRGDVAEDLLPLVTGCDGVEAATPLIESMVTLPDFPGESVRVIGVDPFSLRGVIGVEMAAGTGGAIDLGAWLDGEGRVAGTTGFLSRHHLRVGDTVAMQGSGAPRRLALSAVLTAEDPALSARGSVVAMDIAPVQEWLGTPGKLTAILVKLRKSALREAVRTRLRSILPPGVTVDPPERKTHQVEVMLSAFRLNLTALSMVALLVGMFFVGNTAAASVVRKRVELGILRALGVGKGRLLAMVLVESGFGGCLGSLLGIILAPLLAGMIAKPFAQTVSALYLPVEVLGGKPTPQEALVGFAAGMIASLLAAWIPGMQAAAVDPSRALHPGTAPEIFPVPVGRFAAVGGGLLLATILCSEISLHGGFPPMGFAAAFCVLAGFSLMVPITTVALTRLLRLAMTRWAQGAWPMARMALEHTARSLHRIVPTCAALAAALAMTVGISVMIHSFRGSVVAWVGRTLTADLFVAPAANELLGLVHTLPLDAPDWWRRQSGVLSVGTYREAECRTAEGIPVTLGVTSGRGSGAIDFLHGSIPEKTAELQRGEGVALSESMARRLGLAPGDTLWLATPRGVRSFSVLDLYRDYTRDRGIVLIGASGFAQIWGIQGVHSMAITFRPGFTEDRVELLQREFLQRYGGRAAFACYGNRSLRDRILEIFNQTFSVTFALQVIAIAMAIGGVTFTMSIMVMERSREIGVLRSMGASGRQIVRMLLTEAVLIGVIACGTGLLAGCALALVLTWVINKAFFGWSIELSYPWLELLVLPIWMTGAALIAGAAPARIAAALSPAASLRME
jgi:putative ABC transport system permease protein